MAVSERLVVVDQDAGVDDALALMMLLSQPNIRILAITCVNGNVPLKKVSSNVGRVLEKWGRANTIPVYEGADRPIVRPNAYAYHYHGEDGLGEVSHLYPLHHWKGPEKEHAVMAMIRLAREYPNRVTLLAVGPLTNLALACRMDPEFPSLLKEVIIMGGNIEGKGNAASLGAEFNFQVDPEAAHIVLQEYKKPTLVTLESHPTFSIDYAWCESWFGSDSPRAKFVKSMLQFPFEVGKRSGLPFIPYDPAAAAVFLRPDFIIEKRDVYAQVEVTGQLTRGGMVIDWRNKHGKEANVTIALKYDVGILQDLLIDSLKM